MVKVVARSRAGGYQRLVVMTEKEYEELRAASLLLPSKKTGPGKSLVDKYLDTNAYPELSISERLALLNQAVAREDAGRQFTNGVVGTSIPKTQGIDAPAPTAQYAEVPDIATTSTNTATQDASVKDDDMVGEEVREEDKPDTILPNVSVPALHVSKLGALHDMLQASGTVSVDKLSRVYIDGTLLHAKSNYLDLMRSLFVYSKNDAKLAGRARFFEHLQKLGVSDKHVYTRSAKSKLERLALPPKQEGKGDKTQRKMSEKRIESGHPPGKRPKVLLMYR